MSGTKVIKCKCDSTFQDKEYGKGNRLGNVNEKEDSAVCTVCGSKVNLKPFTKK